MTAQERKALFNGPWYVEAVRPGHEDEARIYDRYSRGVCKPTTDRPDLRRPLAEFIVAVCNEAMARKDGGQ